MFSGNLTHRLESTELQTPVWEMVPLGDLSAPWPPQRLGQLPLRLRSFSVLYLMLGLLSTTGMPGWAVGLSCFLSPGVPVSSSFFFSPNLWNWGSQCHHLVIKWGCSGLTTGAWKGRTGSCRWRWSTTPVVLFTKKQFEQHLLESYTRWLLPSKVRATGGPHLGASGASVKGYQSP